MDHENFLNHRLRNLLHSALLLAAMILLLAWLGRLFLGTAGLVLAIVAVAALFTLGRISPHWVLRMHRAQPLSPYQAPDLYRMVAELARRADLRTAPDLYLVPSPTINAFATGNSSASAIGVTRGLLANLDRRQLAGVLAHEISHIRHHDLWVMGLAQLLSQMTRSLSLFGQLMLLFALILGGLQMPWSALLLAIVAPSVSALLLLALSRTREFEADLGAARLTGDPLGLASALDRLEARGSGWWRILFPVPRRRESSMLDSHPATVERIERLRSIAGSREPRPTQVRRPAVPTPAAEPLFVPIRVFRAPRQTSPYARRRAWHFV